MKRRLTPKRVLKLFKQAASQWLADQAPRMSAALAFYTVFSLAPILIVAIALAGLIFGQKEAMDQMVYQIQEVIGSQSALAVQSMIEASFKPSSSIIATIIGIMTLLLGTTGALVELQEGLNRVWKVQTRGNILHLVRQRLTSLALVASIAFLLIASLVVSAILSAIGTWVSHPTTAKEASWFGVDFVLSCLVITALFAAIFKTLPEAEVHWNEVWIGAAVTGCLFTLGKVLMGLYIGKGALMSTYGAAGSLVALLLWVDYSALVLYYGAEFTKVYADAQKD